MRAPRRCDPAPAGRASSRRTRRGHQRRRARGVGGAAASAASRKTRTTSPIRFDCGERRSTSIARRRGAGRARAQALHAGRLRLHAVQHEEVLAVLRVEREPVGMVDAAELAVVLGEVVVARGEAAGRDRERQAPVGEDLRLDAGGPLGHHGGDPLARELHGRHPARRPQVRRGARASRRCRR